MTQPVWVQNAESGEVRAVDLNEALGLRPPWWGLTEEPPMREGSARVARG